LLYDERTSTLKRRRRRYVAFSDVSKPFTLPDKWILSMINVHQPLTVKSALEKILHTGGDRLSD
jgi:hypothetical protein